MVAEAQTCAIGIITILNILVALYLSRVLYKSTLFMQNKPNLPDAQMNVTSVLTKDYENKSNWKLGENKANTKPIKPNTNPIPEKPKMKLSFFSTKDYENKLYPRTPGKQTQSNPILSRAQSRDLILLRGTIAQSRGLRR